MTDPTLNRKDRVLRALDSHDCRATERVARLAGLDIKDTSQVMCDLIGDGYAVRRSVGCYVMTAKGRKHIEENKRFTSGPNGPLTQAAPRRPRRVTLIDRAWQAMRQQRKFGLADLVSLAASPADDVKRATNNICHYLRRLAKAGYVGELRREPGAALTSNGFKLWLLVRDNGPETPTYSRKRNCVYDPNNQREYALQGGGNG